MTNKEKKEFILAAQRVNARFERKYQRVFAQALGKTVSSLIDLVRERGIGRAIASLDMLLISQHISDPVMRLIREVGLFHARQNYRLIRREIAQKRFGVNEDWLADIMGILRQTIFEQSIIGVTNTMKTRLLFLLEKALAEGMSEDEAIKLLREDGYIAAQAQRIARTETNRATNAGRLVTAQLFDFEMVKEWVSFKDFRTRGRHPKDKKDHYHMDGQVVNLDDTFREPRTGERVEFPTAPGSSAAMSVNCRCQMVTVPKRDENENLIRTERRIPSFRISERVPVRQ